jgi:hypothetical protein
MKGIIIMLKSDDHHLFMILLLSQQFFYRSCHGGKYFSSGKVFKPKALCAELMAPIINEQLP